MRDTSWQYDAPCTKSPEIFFDDESKRWSRKALALGHCGLCPLSDQCADELIYSGSEFGIWAGVVAGDLIAALSPLTDVDPYDEWGDIADSVAWLLVEDDVLV